MDNLAREVLKIKLISLKGTAFQDAVDRIFLIIYSQENFTRVKQKRDMGSDGILKSNTVLAVYAPESYSLNDFKKKITSDYSSYEKNWSGTHEEWIVITNLELTAAMIQHVNKLKKDSQILCIERLLELISEQTWTKKSSIFEALNLQGNYLTNDVLAVVVEDLIKQCDTSASFLAYEKPTYMTIKIDLNIDDSVSKRSFTDEYEEALAIFPTLSYVIQSNRPNGVSAIRSKVRLTYLQLSGAFHDRLNFMVSHLSGNKLGDDFYTYHMRIVLIYFFEQCLFGIKAEEEVML